MTLEELKKMYAEKGGTTQRITQSGDAGDVIDYLTNDLGEGFTAREDQPIIGYEGQGMDATPIYGDKVLSGFMQAKDGMDYFYDPEGVFQGSQKSQEADSFWDTFGPMIIGAMTMGGGTAALGGYLFPSLSATAAAGAGGALVGGANAAFTDQNILKGALKGGVSSAGAMQLGDTGFTLGDATKAINFAQNPTLAGAANLASPYVTTNFDIGDTGFTTNDLLKGANTVQALGSGDNQQIFNAITGLAKDQSGKTGGESYIDPMSKTEGVTGSGYYDEITGRYIKDDLGGLTNPLGRETGNLDPNSKWEYSLTRPGVWVNDKGEEIDLSYLPNTEKVMTGREIMEKAGALPKATGGTAAKTTPNKLDLNALGSAFGVTGIPSEDSLADIKLMQQIFGQDIDYKLASVGGSKRK